ncbi:MAG: hypothetical protein DMF75_16685 [Acidobacteria bacterium]|nr:MAG: hypothetical protein DMF75_16685 [Acidobacteriota bacterium]
MGQRIIGGGLYHHLINSNDISGFVSPLALRSLDFAPSAHRITFRHRRGDVAEWLKAAVC